MNFFGKFNEILSENNNTEISEKINDDNGSGINPSKWITSVIILVILSIVFWYFLGQI